MATGRPRPIPLPDTLRGVIETLQRAGHGAVVVGGAVRDWLLGRPVEDWDVATSATPEVVAGLFPRTTLLHAEHGTVQVRVGEDHFEVTTFREDGPYSDRRHPDHVRYTTDLHTDLARRDFTVNAVAYDPVSETWIDPFGGEEDLRAGRLRTVGDPRHRFEEDALRLLRAARFVAVLEFDADPDTTVAMRLNAPGVRGVSPERVRDELLKTLGARRPSAAFRLLSDTGVLVHVLPELDACVGVSQNEFHAYDVFEHTLRSIDAVAPGAARLRLVALFHDVGKVSTRALREGKVTFYGHERVSETLARERLTALRFPKREVRFVTHVIRHHMFHYESTWTDAAVRRFVARVGEDSLESLLAFHVADRAAKGPDEPPPVELAELRSRIEAERRRRVAFTVRDLAVTGTDLIHEFGLAPGPKIGTLLDGLLESVIEGRNRNERHELLARAREALQGESDG